MPNVIMSPELAFKAGIAAGADVDSAWGVKIIKPEFERALGNLKSDGISTSDVGLIRDEMDGREMSRSVRKMVNKIIADAPDNTELSDEMKSTIADRFRELRGDGDLGDPIPSLPVGARFETFMLEDSRCPPGMMCIWAGETWNAHVPAGPHNAPSDPNEAKQFYLSRSGSTVSTPTFYGPLDVVAAKDELYHHSPAINGARYENGFGASPEGVVLDLQLSFPGAKESYSAEQNGNVVTVTVDLTTEEEFHIDMLGERKDVFVPFSLRALPGEDVTLRVVDYKGTELFTGPIVTPAIQPFPF